MSGKEAITKTLCTLKIEEEMFAYFELLHNNFNHVGKVRLQRFIIRTYSGVNQSWLSQIVKEFRCECERFDGAWRHPIVALPREPASNNKVCMHLLFFEGIIVLHVMCMFVHLSSSTIVKRNLSKDVGRAFLANWVNYHGAPRRILSDTGGMFGSDHF